MDKEMKGRMAMKILSDKELFCKLMAAGLYLSSAQAKINLYIAKNKQIIQEINEDEQFFESLNQFYLEEDEEGLLGAEESVLTAHEVQNDYMDHYGYFTEKDIHSGDTE